MKKNFANQYISTHVWLSFEEAREIVRKIAKKNNITGSIPWRKLYASNILPMGVPRSPMTVYKREWKGWGDWLGTGNIKSCSRENFLSYDDAREIILRDAVPLGINTEKKWFYCKKYGYSRPFNIPFNPQIAYKNKGWISFAHWLGTNNIRGQLRKYTVNDNYFKNWSNDMAYILGFWWADGYMRKRHMRYSDYYIFSICQNTKDVYLLKEILKKMGSNNPIYRPKTRPKGSHFEINSKEIYKDIINIGGTPNKSKIIRIPKIPKQYVSHFIRGLFDGDGCIYIVNNKKKAYQYRVSYICSGSGTFLKETKSLLLSLGIGGKIYSNGNKNNPTLKLCFGVNDTKKLGKLMYANLNANNNLLLMRKLDKFIYKGNPIWNKLVA